MTNDIIIQACGLGKRYHIGKQRHTRSLRDSLGERLTAGLTWPLRLIRSRSGKQPDNNDQSIAQSIEFWALNDISFEVKTGEVLGLIGKNGSGKSTLLKILARITRPTTGYFDAMGRIGALLEVGTGFHPDLTGRENVFLNGSILGMRRKEIAAKFDTIVDFSEIEKFIDTPVKYYSSGMYVRLAFAVAAHLDTDILLLDEVLSVGDLGFQRKSLDKMKSIAKDGRTVILVSHAMESILELCDSVIMLNDGRIYAAGAAKEVVAAYEKVIYA